MVAKAAAAEYVTTRHAKRRSGSCREWRELRSGWGELQGPLFALDDALRGLIGWRQGDRRPDAQISDAQNLHFEASGAFASLQNGQAFVGAGGAAGAVLMNIFPTQKTTSATTTKTITALMRLP